MTELQKFKINMQQNTYMHVITKTNKIKPGVLGSSIGTSIVTLHWLDIRCQVIQ